LRIAIFDYHVLPTNPVGGCHRRLLQGLCQEHEFTVFAAAFDNPCPDRIDWVRVPALHRPLFLLFLTFYAVAPLVFWYHALRTGRRFDLIQTVENYVTCGTVAYSHFCHRGYLRSSWKDSGATGLRGIVRWLDHSLRSLAEPLTYRRVKSVVVPSRGLANELEQQYASVRNKVRVIPNPIDTDALRRPPEFDVGRFRHSLGFTPGDLVLTFIALGHFERKGLPLLLSALQTVDRPEVKLVVVGGRADLIRQYERVVDELGIGKRVTFVGMQHDTRPFLWASDAFVFPSSYEVFSLVSFEAAAAGLPLLVNSVYGVEEFLRDGENGFVITRTIEGIAAGIHRLLELSAEERRAMGTRACRDVQAYNRAQFVQSWRTYYDTFEREAHGTSP
jgi:glycosyltransferase involved in cell wall biosynthesis